MSSVRTHELTYGPRRPRRRLSLRARVLLGLERWFEPVEAPSRRGEHAEYEYQKAAGSFSRAAEEIGGLAGKRVLDFGCGWGGETAWLAQRAASAAGCDIDPQSLEDAERFRQQKNIVNLSFHLIVNDRLPFGENEFDAVFSTNVFEHVMRPTAMLQEIRRVLKPGGRLLTTFGPLFHSPLGYHLPWATQVPYAHLMFGLGPVIEVRNLKRAPICPASWEDTGLNRITYHRFAHCVRQSGLQAIRLQHIPVRNMTLASRLPIVGNLLTFGIDCHLVKPVT